MKGTLKRKDWVYLEKCGVEGVSRKTKKRLKASGKRLKKLHEDYFGRGID